MGNDLDTVVNLAGAWSSWQDERDFPFTPDHCINGTRVAIRSLRKLGVRSRPVSVQMILFNRFAWELWNEGVPANEWPRHAHSIGRVPGAPDAGHGWSGHLMCEGDGWTLDISHRQFHRPGRIVADEPLVLTDSLPWDRDVVWTDEHQQRLLIGRWARNDEWKGAPGWLRPHRSEVSELVERTMALLEEGTAKRR